ncbi:MAG: hypothetical protein GY838_10150 [bacterium]|nr:hypothetical protein [bacterium]
MNDRILVIISTAEAGRAHAGAMYALNALKYEWMAGLQVPGGPGWSRGQPG